MAVSNTKHMAADELARLFVALWPGPAVRARLAAGAARWLGPDAAVVPELRLHMTLHFLGQLPRHRLRLLAEGLVVPMQPFEIVLDRAEVWRNGAAILCPSRLPQELLALQGALAASLRPLGIAPEARSFRPHVTLARRVGAAAPPPSGLGPVPWWVTGYELVESRPSQAGGGYQVLRHYLAGPPPRSRGPDSQPAPDWAEHLQSGPIPL
jgi:2'-5' RNA ligase